MSVPSVIAPTEFLTAGVPVAERFDCLNDLSTTLGMVRRPGPYYGEDIETRRLSWALGTSTLIETFSQGHLGRIIGSHSATKLVLTR